MGAETTLRCELLRWAHRSLRLQPHSPTEWMLTVPGDADKKSLKRMISGLGGQVPDISTLFYTGDVLPKGPASCPPGVESQVGGCILRV